MRPIPSSEDRTAAITTALRPALRLGARLTILGLHPPLDVWRVPPRADTLCGVRLAARLAALARPAQHAGDDAYGSETVVGGVS